MSGPGISAGQGAGSLNWQENIDFLSGELDKLDQDASNPRIPKEKLKALLESFNEMHQILTKSENLTLPQIKELNTQLTKINALKSKIDGAFQKAGVGPKKESPEPSRAGPAAASPVGPAGPASGPSAADPISQGIAYLGSEIVKLQQQAKNPGIPKGQLKRSFEGLEEFHSYLNKELSKKKGMGTKEYVNQLMSLREHRTNLTQMKDIDKIFEEPIRREAAPPGGPAFEAGPAGGPASPASSSRSSEADLNKVLAYLKNNPRALSRLATMDNPSVSGIRQRTSDPNKYEITAYIGEGAGIQRLVFEINRDKFLELLKK